jgi:hypothetical protein
MQKSVTAKITNTDYIRPGPDCQIPEDFIPVLISLDGPSGGTLEDFGGPGGGGGLVWGAPKVWIGSVGFFSPETNALYHFQAFQQHQAAADAPSLYILIPFPYPQPIQNTTGEILSLSLRSERFFVCRADQTRRSVL